MKQEAYAVLFSPKILETTVMRDNNKLWKPYAIFQTAVEAMEYRKEKWLGTHTNTTSDIKIKKVVINF